MIGYEQYTQVKDNYCICYFGYSDEYLVQLRLLKPALERRFPGLNICFGGKDDKIHLLGNDQPNLKISGLKKERRGFGHIREIRFNGKTHPIEDLLAEAGGTDWAVPVEPQPRRNNKAVVITIGNYPTKPMEGKIKLDGWEIEYDGDTSDASLVIGVESIGLFEAAGRGIATELVPTGLGTRLYKLMFPNGRVRHR
jgi:hypothetical protein